LNKATTIDTRDKEIQALKDSIQAYKQDAMLKQQEIV
jgi:hypothetical protein